MRLTTKGRKLASRLLADYVLSLSDAEIDRLPRQMWEPTDEELVTVLFAWGAFMNEDRSEAWYQAQCRAILMRLFPVEKGRER